MAFARIGDADKAWELLRMINPVNHAADAGAVATYKVEPYVVAADVYAVAPHIGRGGWTWYTGSAGWMYRLIVESLLGLHRTGHLLRIAPCLPAEWSGYRMQYRYGETTYRIDVRRDRAAVATQVRLDGQMCARGEIALVDDLHEHRVDIVLEHSPPGNVH
jgi:cellobiose phosphorylase